MAISTMTEVITNLGFPIGLVLIFLVLIVKYINKQNKITREDTKEQISILRQENKEDKQLFKSAIDSFNISVQEFRSVQQETIDIKGDLKEVKQDLLIIKTKMDK
jgi:hypothetical protein